MGRWHSGHSLLRTSYTWLFNIVVTGVHNTALVLTERQKCAHHVTCQMSHPRSMITSIIMSYSYYVVILNS